MKEIPSHFDAELPPRIYLKRALPLVVEDDIQPTVMQCDVREREVGLSTRTAIALLLLVIGGVYFAMNAVTLKQCIDEHLVCEFE